MKSAHIYANYSNMVVMKSYMDVVKSAIEMNGIRCDYITDMKEMPQNDLYFFPMGIDAYKFRIKGYKNYILWQQGATADESYLRNHSRIRYMMLNHIDCVAMKNAKFILFCSNYMREHYEKLSRDNYDNKSYLMPCYNEQINIDAIKGKDYSKHTFAYVGSLDLWQCFEKTARIYKEIETRYPDASLKVLTFSVQEAEEILKNIGVRNYEVKCVEKEQVQNELKDVVYGFILRDDSIVNRVATPTKFSSYLSVGVIPIFSEVLDDFYRVSKGLRYVIPVGTVSDLSSILNRIGITIDREKLMKEYMGIFDEYYNTQKHMLNISDALKDIL